MILCLFYFFPNCFQLIHFKLGLLQTTRKQYVSNFKLSFLHTNWKGWHDACQSRIKIVVLTPQDSKTSGNITCMLWPSSRLRQLLSQVWHVFVKIAVNYRSWATKPRMYKNVRFSFIIPAIQTSTFSFISGPVQFRFDSGSILVQFWFDSGSIPVRFRFDSGSIPVPF